MVSLTPAFLTLAVFCTSALAAPWVQSSKHVTHRVRTLPNGLQVRSYHPESTYKTFPEGVKPPVSANGLTSNFKASALSFIHQQLGEENVQYTSGYTNDVASHHYVNQHFNGIPVANAVAHSTLNKDGNVVAFSSSFVTGKNNVANATPSISKEDALAAVKAKLGATPTDREVKLEYFADDDGSVILSHVVEAHIDDNGHLVEAFINAHTGEVASIIDFTTSLTYLALPITKQAPTEGIETIVNPEDSAASPNGWTVISGTDSKATAGNNVVVYKSSQTSNTKESSTDTFNYPWAPASQASVSANVDAARVNAFYIVNTIHDITYRYGFTESAFNFQNDNLGKGGKGNDRVTVSVQDSAGTDNADFTTPADGSSGAMRMFLWDLTTIRRDGALENDIVVHEFTHGVSNRLTGGGTGRCLTSTEAGGMGEGWSDAFAEWTEHKDATVPDFTMGAYVINDAAGIRSNPYSTSKTVNPYTYATIATKNEVHDIGEIWANLLHNVYAALVTANGFSADAKTNPDATGGNAIFLHLFIDSFSLQPCNPTFPTARDAWIQADVNRYSGANKCTLWKAFASRGLGVSAANHKDSTDIPAECSGTSTPTSTVSSTTTRSTSTSTSTSTRSTSTSTRSTSTSTTTKTSSTSTRSTSTRTTSTRTPTPTPTPEPEPECPWWWPFDFCF